MKLNVLNDIVQDRRELDLTFETLDIYCAHCWSNWIAGICNLIIAYVSQLQFLSLNLIKIWVGMQAGRLFINQRERYR